MFGYSVVVGQSLYQICRCSPDHWDGICHWIYSLWCHLHHAMILSRQSKAELSLLCSGVNFFWSHDQSHDIQNGGFYKKDKNFILNANYSFIKIHSHHHTSSLQLIFFAFVDSVFLRSDTCCPMLKNSFKMDLKLSLCLSFIRAVPFSIVWGKETCQNP